MKLTTKQIKQIIKEELKAVLEGGLDQAKYTSPFADFDEDLEIQKEFFEEMGLELTDEGIPQDPHGEFIHNVIEASFEHLLEKYKNILNYIEKNLSKSEHRMGELAQELEWRGFDETWWMIYRTIEKSKAFEGMSTKDYKSMYGLKPAGSVTKLFAHEQDINSLIDKIEEMIKRDKVAQEELSLIKPFLLDLVGNKITHKGKTYSLDLVKATEHLLQIFELWRTLTGK